jgi:hypothetical protein
MKRRLLYLFVAAGLLALVFGCSNKTSDQACIHEVTMNLDRGNYDAVLASACANDMQKGAAYFGLSGFDIKNVINSLSQTGSTTSSPTNTQSDLGIYMTSLVTNATGTSLNYMDLAVSAYSRVTTTSTTGSYTADNYRDAQFYISLVDAVKSLSLISIVMPNLLGTNGTLNTACDNNKNGVPDDADATSCALIASAVISQGASTLTCTGALYTRSTPTDLTLTDIASGQTVTGTYSGLLITISTVTGGTTAGCVVTPPNPSLTQYKKLLYKDASGRYWSATTTADLCRDQTGAQWPCPIIQNNAPLDLVSAIDQTLTTAVSSLNSSLTSSVTGTTTDVQQAITDIQAQACCGCTTTPCTACSTPCTSQNIANYIQTNLH